MRTPDGIPRRGTVTIILLGLLSVMIFLAFTLSQRQRGHGQLVAFSDSHLYARYFLESYLGDVIYQVKNAVNEPTADGRPNPLYDFLRGPVTGEFPRFYTPSKLVKSIPDTWASELGLDITPDWTPTIGFDDLKPLEYPPSVNVPEVFREKVEKRGLIAVTCSVRVQGRQYFLSAKIPFSVVMRLSPVLREFILFANKISLEQIRPFGREDRLNLILTKDGVHPKEPDLQFDKVARQPWVLWPAINHMNDPNHNGRVFLGKDDEPIFLNLAGERLYRKGPVSELWQIPPQWFKVNQDPARPDDFLAFFTNNAIFMDQNMKFIHFRGLDIPLQLKGFVAKMGILGFCYELFDKTNGFFAGTPRDAEKIWGSDPSFQKLVDPSIDPSKPAGFALALSSALKVYGLNGELDLPDESTPYTGPAREVFGTVYGRFMVLTFFEFPSAQGGGQILTYDSNPNAQPPEWPKYQKQDKVRFQPPNNLPYAGFMSRVVSGGADRDVLGATNYMYYNSIDPEHPDKWGRKVPLDASRFLPQDGIRFVPRGKFNDFTDQWLKWDEKMALGAVGPTLQSRVSLIFRDQKEFKRYALAKKDVFRVAGVVYVHGSLDLDPITTADIRGGIVIVENDITLGDITRGLDFTGDPPIERIYGAMENLSQSRFLTFVSRKGKINLKGNKHLGVHLIALDPALDRVREQITWLQPDKIVFGGGIAVDTPNLENRVKEFGRAGKDPIFLFAPAMASPNIDTVVQVYPTMDAYRFSIDRAETDRES